VVEAGVLAPNLEGAEGGGGRAGRGSTSGRKKKNSAMEATGERRESVPELPDVNILKQ